MADLILPAGVDRYDRYDPMPAPDLPSGHGTIVNDTGLSDDLVQHAVATYFEETASMLGANSGNTFQTYANQGGSILARSKFRTPGNVYEEICLARDLAERDDDVATAIGAMLALAFGPGFQHTHEDEVTVSLFDEMAKRTRLQLAFKEIYREFLLASQFTTVSLFTSETLQFRPQGADRMRSRRVVTPRVAVLPSEQIVPMGDDSFNTAPLFYRPRTAAQENWLREYFGERTTPGRKLEMRRQNPVLTALLLEEIETTSALIGPAYFGTDEEPPATGQFLYRLNPRMAHRTTMPKGSWPHPRPLMTRNFPLLEAKRLLNVMDYSLLEGGSNFLVVAKKGSDQRPAMPQELAGLADTIRRASRSGVMIGDHRLSIEIITPDLKELLNPAKRRLIGRKLATALLRLPDFQGESSGSSGAGVVADVEILSKVIADDRSDIKLHIEQFVYGQTATRNSASFQQGAAELWFPIILLQGTDGFTDLVLKLRDRGDIPRKFGVEAAGYNYQHAVAQRKLEKANGDDRVLTAPPIPFQGADGAGGGGPQDNNNGRPRGGSSDNGRPGARQGGGGTDPNAPRRQLTRNAGETVTAIEDNGSFFRIGELTHAVLEEYAAVAGEGRVTALERRALQRIDDGDFEPFIEGPLTIVPVNVDEDLAEIRAVRLATGLSMLVGRRYDNAILARALSFRQPEFRGVDAQETALRWGFDCGPIGDPRNPATPVAPADAPEELAGVPGTIVNVLGPGAVTKKILRDKDNNIIGVEERPAEDGGE